MENCSTKKWKNYRKSQKFRESISCDMCWNVLWIVRKKKSSEQCISRFSENTLISDLLLKWKRFASSTTLSWIAKNKSSTSLTIELTFLTEVNFNWLFSRRNSCGLNASRFMAQGDFDFQPKLFRVALDFKSQDEIKLEKPKKKCGLFVFFGVFSFTMFFYWFQLFFKTVCKCWFYSQWLNCVSLPKNNYN